MTPQTFEKAEAPVSLDLLAELARDPQLRQEWRGERSPELGKLFDDAFLLIGGLKHASAWEIETLLDELGCHRRSREELESLEAPDLEHCIAFLEWLTDLERETPDVDVTCELLRTASRMYARLRRDVGERESLISCELIVNAPLGQAGDRDLTPLDLIRIGEVGPAFQFAATMAKGKLGDDARQLADENPFSRLSLVHVRPSIMDAILRFDVDSPTLSSERIARLAEHIDGCDACRREYEAHVGPAEPPLQVRCTPLAPLSR